MEQEPKKKYNLTMGMAEIRTRYLGAADKRQQIKILAECNACSKEKIREILIEQGVPEDELPKTRAPRKKPEEKNKAPDTKEEKKPDKNMNAAVPDKKLDASVCAPQAVFELVAEEIDRLMDEIVKKEEKLAVLHAFLISAREEK